MVPLPPVLPVVLNNHLDGLVGEDFNVFSLLKSCHHLVALLAREVDLGDIEPEVVVKLLELLLAVLFLLLL